MEITTHTMVRDEINTVLYGIASLAPIVKRCLVTDTGSTDGTWEALNELKELFPQIEIERVVVPDSRDWGWNDNTLTINFEQTEALASIRQSHIDKTETDVCWLLDGDEVYCEGTIKRIKYFLYDLEKAIYVPFLHFAQDHEHTAYGFPFYGRIFATEGLSIQGKYPDEQHCSNGDPLFPNSEGVMTLTPDIIHPVHHYQMVYKPHRRNLRDVIPYQGIQPEVFSDERIKDLIKRNRI